MRKMARPVVLMLSIFLTLLLYQTVAFDHKKQGKGSSSIGLEVNVTIHKNDVEITYRYDKLRPGIYTVVAPEPVTCSYENKKQPCRLHRKGEQERLALEQVRTVSFTYHKTKASDRLLTDWQLSLVKDGKVIPVDQDIVIQDFIEQDRLWIASGEKIADVSKEHMRYFHYKPDSLASYPLVSVSQEDRGLWSHGRWDVTYDSGHPLKSDKRNKVSDLSDLYEPTFIELDKHTAESHEGYVSIVDRRLEKVERILFREKLRDDFHSDQLGWGLPLLSSLFFSEDPSLTEKQVEMVRMMRATFNASQLSELKRQLLRNHQDQKLVPFLDQSLSDLYGKPTTFISENRQSDVLIPFYFRDRKEVWFGSERMGWNTITYQGERYYPLGPLTEAAGYPMTILENAQAYHVDAGESEYRFYLGQGTFIVNEQEFGVADSLLVSVDGKVHINGSFLGDLFKIGVNEDDQQIFLQKK